MNKLLATASLQDRLISRTHRVVWASRFAEQSLHLSQQSLILPFSVILRGTDHSSRNVGFRRILVWDSALILTCIPAFSQSFQDEASDEADAFDILPRLWIDPKNRFILFVTTHRIATYP